MSQEKKGEIQKASDRNTRRNVLKAMAGGSALAIGSLAQPVAQAAIGGSKPWSMQADVIVVGSGAAGSAAAIAAAKNGASVIMLEKMPFLGGTTAKSDGVFWIPNNPLLKSRGIVDERIDALRYMVRLSYPTRYDPEDKWLGVSEKEFSLIATFFDNGDKVIEKLQAAGALKIASWKNWEGDYFTDYHSPLPEDKVPQGRSLMAKVAGEPNFTGGGNGAELLRQLHAVFDQLKIKTYLQHRVQKLIRNVHGDVIGVEVERDEGGAINIQARKSVIFCSGGFTNNPDMCNRFLRGHIWGGGAAPGSTGDFINIAATAGAALGNMSNAWWGQVPVEVALKTRSVPQNVWVVPGDSTIQVNRFGRRFVNEKGLYNERTQAHFYWDAVRDEYPNLLGFMIWDARNAKLFPGISPIPPANTDADHVIKGDTLDELAVNLAARLAKLTSHTGGVKLDASFLGNLKESVVRFNEFSKQGVDGDFARGATPAQIGFHLYGRKKDPSPHPNPTMYPISESGPYYAAILGAGTLDTKGGPIINSKGQVMNTFGEVISGLYGAGNCIASPAGQAYWAGGGTIGPALTYGYLAGENAAKEHPKTA